MTGTDASVAMERYPLGADDAVAVVLRLNRPDQLNPIDSGVLTTMDGMIDQIEADPTARTVLVTGTGRAFSAGGDLKAYISLQTDPVAFPRFVSELQRIFGRFRDLAVPVVALVNGV